MVHVIILFNILSFHKKQFYIDSDLLVRLLLAFCLVAVTKVSNKGFWIYLELSGIIPGFLSMTNLWPLPW